MESSGVKIYEIDLFFYYYLVVMIMKDKIKRHIVTKVNINAIL